MTGTTEIVRASAQRGLDVPRPAIAVTAMIALAGLDLLGAVLARTWSESHSGNSRGLLFGAGVLVFVALFAVYAQSLRFADLIPVTFGWIAILQVGLMIIDAAGKQRSVPAGHWAAAAVIIALEGYLLFASG